MSESDNKSHIDRDLTPTERVRLERIDGLRQQHDKVVNAIKFAEDNRESIKPEVLDRANIERLRLEYLTNRELNELYTPESLEVYLAYRPDLEFSYDSARIAMGDNNAGKSARFGFICLPGLGAVTGRRAIRALSYCLLVVSILASTNAAWAEETAVECDRLAAAPLDYQRTAPAVKGNEFNVKKAEKACRQALAQTPRNPRLLFQLGYVLIAKNEMEEARDYLEQSAEKDYPAAAYYLGLYYDTGWGGEKDGRQAFEWFSKAAARGHRDAQFFLARKYQTGEGTGQNLEKALFWFRKAADQGHALAQYAAGVMYYGGGGVKEDLRQAQALIRAAAAQGLPQAQYSLGEMYLRGHGLEKSPEEALRWFMEAANRGYLVALVHLGEIYYEGKAVPKNLAEARKWFCKAGNFGRDEFKRNYSQQLRCGE